MLILIGCVRPIHPRPIVVPAIDGYIRDIGEGVAIPTPSSAVLPELGIRLHKYRDIVRTAIRNWRHKRKCSIAGKGQVIASIVLNNHVGGLADRKIESNDLSSNGVKNCRADDLNIGHVRRGRASVVGDRADLCRSGWLRLYGDIVGRSADQKDRKLEVTVP